MDEHTLKQRDEVQIKLRNFKKQLESDPVVQKYEKMVNNPFSMLVGITLIGIFYALIFTGFYPLSLDFFAPANIIVVLLLSTITMIPIVAVLSWRLDKQKKQLIEEM
ncbi:MAG: hypothetical protein ACTSYO_09525, partial [Candidatus Ranarchaeia archaeon]